MVANRYPLWGRGLRELCWMAAANGSRMIVINKKQAGCEGMNAFSKVLWAAVATLATGASLAREQDVRGVEQPFDETAFASERGFAVQIDNDLFSGAHRDEDYSW